MNEIQQQNSNFLKQFMPLYVEVFDTKSSILKATRNIWLWHLSWLLLWQIVSWYNSKNYRNIWKYLKYCSTQLNITSIRSSCFFFLLVYKDRLWQPIRVSLLTHCVLWFPKRKKEDLSTTMISSEEVLNTSKRSKAGNMLPHTETEQWTFHISNRQIFSLTTTAKVLTSQSVTWLLFYH